MGATGWQFEIAWQADPAEALRALQAETFRRAFDFDEELERWRADAERTLRAEQEAGDPYALAQIWAEQLERIAAARLEPPASVSGQIDVLRRVLPEGFGNVLDVTGVDFRGGTHVARLLDASEQLDLFGSERPSGQAVRDGLHRLFERLRRGECVAFAACDDDGRPVRWFFVGRTVD